MGRTAVLGCGLSVYWATLELGEDLDIAEELEALHGIRVQCDDGFIIVGGLVDLQPVWRLLPLQDRHQVVVLPLQIGGRRLALARHGV